QSSGDSADATRNGEGQPMDPFNIDANGLCTQDGIAASAHGVAEGRKQKAPQQENADRCECEREQEVDPRLVEWRPRPHPDPPVAPASQRLPLKYQSPDDLSERERQ